jgi:hypothetical protein
MSHEPSDSTDPKMAARHNGLREIAISAKERAIAIATVSKERANRSLVKANRARAMIDRTNDRLAREDTAYRHRWGNSDR